MEYYRKCNVCGKIVCYNDEDIKENEKNSMIAGFAALGSIANGVAGTRYDMYEMNKIADKAKNRVDDYTHCSNCGSRDTELVTKKFAIFSNKKKNEYNIDELIIEANNYLKKDDYENAFCFATMVLVEDENNYDAYLIRFLSSFEISSIDELDSLNEDYSNNQHFLNLLNVSKNKQKEKLLLISDNNRNKIIKTEANMLLKSKDYDNEMLEKINGILGILKHDTANSTNNNLIDKLEEKKKMVMYDLACKYINNDKYNDLLYAIELFSEIIDYKDSKDKLQKCKELKRKKKNKINIIFILLGCAVIIGLLLIIFIPLESKYNKARTLYDEKKYDEAIEIYEGLGDYKDSTKKLEISKNEKIYSQAVDDYNNGYFYSAYKDFKSIKQYKDSSLLMEKSLLYSHIESHRKSVGVVYKDFDTRDQDSNEYKYEKDADFYYTANVNNYKTIKNSDEIKKIIINKWHYIETNMYNGYNKAIFYENGNVNSFSTFGWINWYESDGLLYIISGGVEKTKGYEIKEIESTGIYLLTSNNKPAYILILDGSEIAKKLWLNTFE